MDFIKRAFGLYYDGFKSMSGWGRKVWIIIIIKLFIMFAILKIFFFPDFLARKFSNDEERGNWVREQIINTK
ncbi:MAG: DUF4492 domain-containing protein [Bacteroidales bacterium]